MAGDFEVLNKSQKLFMTYLGDNCDLFMAMFIKMRKVKRAATIGSAV